MEPDNSVVITIKEKSIKMDIAVRLHQDTRDALFKLPKSCPGISLSHPDKESKNTFFGYEIKFNDCWTYVKISTFLVKTLEVDQQVKTIRLRNLITNNDTVLDCTQFSIDS